MSEIQSGQTAEDPRGAKPKRDGLTLALYGLSLVGVAAVLYVILGALSKPKPSLDLKSLAKGSMAHLSVVDSGPPAPANLVLDPQGKSVSLGGIKADVVIVNLWATWCAPCRQEMPTLAALQAAYPGRVAVIPVAEDRAEDRDKARDFIAQYPPLAFYQDPKLAMTFALSPPAEGLPTTVIYDHSGHERARLAGGADWNSLQARAVVEALLRGG